MFPHNIQASTKTDMNVLEVIDHKSLGGDDLSTHYAGENETQPGHCHDGPGQCEFCPANLPESLPENLPMRQIICNAMVNGSSVSG